MVSPLTVILSLIPLLAPVGAKDLGPDALGSRLEKSHSSFLESRRALFHQLSNPYQVAPKARVIEEEPKAWKNQKTPWRRNIQATVFWVGETPTTRNPTSNHASSWDPNWLKNFGGIDDPVNRNGYLPEGFLPQQTPFYIALPYNDLAPDGSYHPEASEAIPWFWQVKKGPYKSTCHGRWLALHRNGRICYARWKDAGPFSTDDWKYVFQGEKPKPNPNHNAGIDISPAVRDYLQLEGNEPIDWKFIEDYEVPDGPWKNWHPTAQ